MGEVASLCSRNADCEPRPFRRGYAVQLRLWVGLPGSPGTSFSSEQETEHQRAMQRRAIRDAKTPDKMKKSKFVKEDSNLTLQEKKEKIQSGLKKLTELGTVNPKNRYQELINDIARVRPRGAPVAWPWSRLSEACGDSARSEDRLPSLPGQIGGLFGIFRVFFVISM